MNKKAVIVALALGAVALLLMARKAQAAPVWTEEGGDGAPDVPAYDSGAAGWIDEFEAWAKQNQFETEQNAMPLQTPIVLRDNIAAMQAAISEAEGTAAGHGDPYRVCYAYAHTIVSFADHPAVTKEWAGEKLSDKMCAGAGLGPGCVSTAAGKYQITKPTWLRVQKKLGLPDFSPASQDAAAAELLKERGAVAYLEVGDFAAAVRAARKEWASLPGAGYGQGERTIEWLTAKFTAAGGVLA